MTTLDTGRVIVVGAGLAGLYAALKLAPLPVLLISPEPLGSGASSAWAQGGVAAAMGAEDTPMRHAADTIRAGAGIVDAAVASYVTTVIKAANASGASMNAMLKAQMLSTALGVYFIGFGNVGIDLTKVCANPTTCTSYENTSAAFGGASSLTVSQILAYAASQSNPGGTVWYGQVKATQGLAKDTYDAINNQVAFGA